MSRHIPSRIAAVVSAAVLVALAVSHATPVAASQGSIPEEVAAYASDPNQMLATLDDFVGVDASGKGIDFSEGAAVGTLNRVFGFTQAWLDGKASDPAIELRNEWLAPITIDAKPVGVAIIWINESTVLPELANFIQDEGMTAALKDVPAESWLVQDEPRGAWFILTGTKLSAMGPGASGTSAPTSLDTYQSFVTGEQPQPDATDDSVIVPVVIVGGASLIVIAAVLVPLLLRRRRQLL